MPDRSRKRPRDANQLAKFIVDTAAGELSPKDKTDNGKNPAAVALGRMGGLKGGKARAEALTAEQRKRIAAHAAAARWGTTTTTTTPPKSAGGSSGKIPKKK